jgi:hypothetical protein
MKVNITLQQRQYSFTFDAQFVALLNVQQCNSQEESAVNIMRADGQLVDKIHPGARVAAANYFHLSASFFSFAGRLV